MSKKLQSQGSQIASASFKPDVASGASHGPIPAFGYIRAGEIVEFNAIRLWNAREGKLDREILGSETSESWEPYELVVQTTDLRLRRTTSWDDRHVQWWNFPKEKTPQEIVIWCDFQTFAPTEVSVQDGQVWWKTIEGNFILLATRDSHLLSAAVGRDAEEVRRQLELGAAGVAWTQIQAGDKWEKGIAAIRLRGSEQGLLALVAGTSPAQVLEKMERTLAQPEAIVGEMKKTWSDFFSHDVPACPVADEQMQKVWHGAWYTLRANEMDYGIAPLAKPFGSPSKFNYTHQWLWDSCFQAIVWSRSNRPERAQAELDNLIENPQENGRISHEILYSKWLNWGDGLRGKNYFAPTSQPPVVANAVDRVYQRTGDRAWLARSWSALKGYLDWWQIARDPDHDGLAGWASGWESGLDDSPRWDHIARDHNTYFIGGVVEATELNALLVNEWRTMARLGRTLGLEDEALACEQKSQAIRAAMREKLWNKSEGFFFCLDHEEKPIRMKTIGGLLGLVALEKGDPEIKPLIDHLKDETTFWTSFPVPSVARNEKSFERGQMWRGPTWLSTNWLLIQALERIGESAVAQELRKRTLDMIMVSGEPVIYEWYDPISGRGLGNMDFGWSTLVIDLLYG